MSDVQPDLETVVRQDRISVEDWLVITGYHDHSYRERELIKFRNLKTLDDDYKRIMNELFGLRQERIQIHKEDVDLQKKEMLTTPGHL